MRTRACRPFSSFPIPPIGVSIGVRIGVRPPPLVLGERCDEFAAEGRDVFYHPAWELGSLCKILGMDFRESVFKRSDE